MLEELVVFAIILVISLFFKHLISKGRSLSPFYGVLIRLAYIGIVISTIIGAACFFRSVRFAPVNTLYQIFLIVFSIFILWALLYYFEIVFFLDVFYYLSIAIIYWGLKLGFMGVSKVIFLTRTKTQKPHNLRIRRFARRRYKPQKPHKIGIEEAPW